MHCDCGAVAVLGVTPLLVVVGETRREKHGYLRRTLYNDRNTTEEKALGEHFHNTTVNIIAQMAF